MNVTAIIVTRGNVDLDPIYKSLPDAWEVVVWDNSGEQTRGWPEVRAYRTAADGWVLVEPTPCENLSVYGRYAAIEYASHELIYVQDDDVIVSDPEALVEEWLANGESPGAPDGKGNGHLVANMPQEFRPHYPDSCLVGFGACFHRDLPGRAFERFFAGNPARDMLAFYRTCDVVFTFLSPRVLVDVPKVDREFASDSDRMWKQPHHHGERQRMLGLARTLA